MSSASPFDPDDTDDDVTDFHRWHRRPTLASPTHDRRQAATSGVFLSRFHFGLLSEKHVSRDACNSPNTPLLLLLTAPLLPPSRKGEVRGREWDGGDHPHWDHSPSIRPFHTLWTWNNQGLIAAVCLCRPWLKTPRLTALSQSGPAAERSFARMHQRIL